MNDDERTAAIRQYISELYDRIRMAGMPVSSEQPGQLYQLPDSPAQPMYERYRALFPEVPFHYYNGVPDEHEWPPPSER